MSRRAWLSLALALSSLTVDARAEPLASASAPPVARFAIVIGNNAPESGKGAASSPARAPLRYADDDAVATHRLLRDAGIDSVLITRLDPDTRDVAALEPRAPPRLADVEQALARALGQINALAARGAASELFLFFSGHGDVEAGEGFIVLEDGRLTRSRLFELLSRSAARRNHVFVDACKSYFLVFDRGPGGRRAPWVDGALPRALPMRLQNTGFVLSTSHDRESHEWERFQGGILSHELRSALRGAGDTNRDGQISYAELGAFFTKANQAIDNPRFRPEFLLRAPDGDPRAAVLAWPTASAPLQVEPEFAAAFFVESARGERLLDAHPARGQGLSLQLGSERPLFLRSKAGSLELVIRGHEPISVSELSPAAPEIASRGALSLAFERLFTVPLHDSDVRVFERAYHEAPAPPSTELPTNPWRVATGVVALAAAGAGATLSGIALAKSLDGADTPQRDLPEHNRELRQLNAGWMVSYGVSLVAATLWAWPSLWEAPVTPLPVSSDGGLSLGLGVNGSF